MSAIKSSDDKFLMLETAKIVKAKPAREEDDERFDELKASINEFGLIEPIVVAPRTGNGKFDVLAGNRRFRACSELGLHEIPAIVRPSLDPIERDILTLIENVQRKDLIDREKRDGLIAIYKKIGFDSEKSMRQLYKIHNGMDIEGGERIKHNLELKARQLKIKIDEKFCTKYGIDIKFAKYSNLTGFKARSQIKFLKLLEIDDEILDAAEESGLNIDKKRLIVSTKLKRKGKDTKVHKSVQKEALRQIKIAENTADARARVNQLGMDVQTGAFDPDTSEYRDRFRDKINTRLESNMSYLVYGINNGAMHIMEHITGLGTYTENLLINTITEDKILSTKNHMIDVSKKLKQRDIAALQSHLIPLKMAVDLFIDVLYDELESREAKSKLVRP